MAGNKYLDVGSDGHPEENVSIQTSVGVGDAGKIIGLDSTGKIDNSMMPTGVGADTQIINASEALGAGDDVNIWDDAGTIKVRLADASGGTSKKSDGFVLAAVTLGNPATVYFDGTNNQKSGLTGGSEYFLSAITPGGVTTTPPTGTSEIVQSVGKALSATELSYEPGKPITRA